MQLRPVTLIEPYRHLQNNSRLYKIKPEKNTNHFVWFIVIVNKKRIMIGLIPYMSLVPAGHQKEVTKSRVNMGSPKLIYTCQSLK